MYPTVADPTSAVKIPSPIAFVAVRNRSPVANPVRPHIMPPSMSPTQPAPSWFSSFLVSLVILVFEFFREAYV